MINKTGSTVPARRSFRAGAILCGIFNGLSHCPCFRFAPHAAFDSYYVNWVTLPSTPECNGYFGFPMRRYIGTQSHLTPIDHAKRIKEIVRCFMIEKVTALDHIDEICSIPGVDMVQFGSGDWSMNQGFDRNDCPEICKEAECKMIETALKYGVRPRCEVKNAEDAKYYKSLGVQDISLDDDMYSLRRFWFEEGAKFRQIVKDE